MAKTRQQQRADKKRREAQVRKKAAASRHEQPLWVDPQPPVTGPASHGCASNGRVPNGSPSSVRVRSAAELTDLAEQVTSLIRSGLTLANAGAEFRTHFDSIIDSLVDLDGVLASIPLSLRDGSTRVQRPEATLGSLLVQRIGELWESGWQPLDVVHVARKERTPTVARLAGVLIHCQAARFAGIEYVPDEWADQLAAIPTIEDPGSSAKAPLIGWRTKEHLSVADSLHDGLLLLGLLGVLPRLTGLCDPPSLWSTRSKLEAGCSGDSARAGSREARSREARSNEARSSETGSSETASAKNLSTIRALLAKAEATTFEAEREVFAAKAQDLMTRYSIDAAVLDQRHGEQLGAGVRSRRIHLDNPYATEKFYLLSTVARLNNVRVVYEERFAMAAAVGFPSDIELTDLLFTSLLVQAAKGLQDLVITAGKGRSSSASFRRAYWVAYGVRIGERLTEAQTQATHEAEAAYGGGLVLVLKEREEAVSSVMDELYKNTKTMKTRRLDAAGWDAGRSAASNANLGTPKARLRS